MPAFDPELLAAYTVAALALSLAPGPDMLFCFANGVAHGARGHWRRPWASSWACACMSRR
ncbi:hypothetical protein HHL28_03465 [Aerophototrophica crusticola]|uniref:Lysine transporter LysE n=1 Tax=Aerophototrophica crusticola TaxID=1709002 RepID=A0A858R4H1_9PROT|nr:hypothetical protein HHL28_03465 [Rhodospirillaceae bacterium B3]